MYVKVGVALENGHLSLHLIFYNAVGAPSMCSWGQNCLILQFRVISLQQNGPEYDDCMETNRKWWGQDSRDEKGGWVWVGECWVFLSWTDAAVLGLEATALPVPVEGPGWGKIVRMCSYCSFQLQYLVWVFVIYQYLLRNLPEIEIHLYYLTPLPSKITFISKRQFLIYRISIT